MSLNTKTRLPPKALEPKVGQPKVLKQLFNLWRVARAVQKAGLGLLWKEGWWYSLEVR